MSNAVEAILVLSGAAFAIMVCGSALAFGVGTVCRWMKWAPVNFTVNIYNFRDENLADAVKVSALDQS